MPSYLHTLQHLANENLLLAFGIIYLVAILLGDIPAFIAFWLGLQGILGPWGVPLLIFTIGIAYISGDVLWYSIGRSLRGTRTGEFIKNHLPHHERLEGHIHKNAERWIFLSKFIISSSFPILFLVGWSGFDFKKTVRQASLAVLAWMPVLTLSAFALFAWLTPLRAIATFRRIELIFSIGLVLFILINYLITYLVEKLYDEEEQ